MADEKFVEFARHRLRFGTPTQDVAATLRINGLSEAEIQEVLTAAQSPAAPPFSAPEPTPEPQQEPVAPTPPPDPMLQEPSPMPPAIPTSPVTVLPQMPRTQTPKVEASTVIAPLPPAPPVVAVPHPNAPARVPEVPAAMIYAGFWRRATAAVIDGVILTFLYSGIAIGVSLAMKVDASSYAQFVQGPGLIISLIASLVGLLYHPLLEASRMQGSLGKHFLGLIVTDASGMRISFFRALLRNLAKVTSAVIFMIGFLMVAFTKQKQGLHDMIAGCLVLRQEPAH